MKKVIVTFVLPLLFSCTIEPMGNTTEPLAMLETIPEPLINMEGLWEGQVIPYYLDERYEGTEQHQILLEAMAEFEALGFHFERGYDLFNMPEDFVYIKWSGGAHSGIGRLGGEQELYLRVTVLHTFRISTIHMLGYTVGLYPFEPTGESLSEDEKQMVRDLYHL